MAKEQAKEQARERAAKRGEAGIGLEIYRLVAIDVFGKIIPGIVLVLGALFALGLPIRDTTVALHSVYAPETDCCPHDAPTGYQRRKEGRLHTYLVDLAPYQTGLAVLLLASVYVVGTVAVRGNKAKLDAASFRSIKDGIAVERWPVSQMRKKPLVRNKYPYPNLKQYFNARGLTRLGDKVPWTREDTGGKTVAFIRALKARIEFHEPHRYLVLHRLEARINMLLGIWHVLRVLFWISIIGLGFIGATLLLCCFVVEHPCWADSLETLASTVTILVACVLGWRGARRHFHYQRVRELTLIFEVAYQASLTNDDIFPEPSTGG